MCPIYPGRCSLKGGWIEALNAIVAGSCHHQACRSPFCAASSGPSRAGAHWQGPYPICHCSPSPRLCSDLIDGGLAGYNDSAVATATCLFTVRGSGSNAYAPVGMAVAGLFQKGAGRDVL